MKRHENEVKKLDDFSMTLHYKCFWNCHVCLADSRSVVLEAYSRAHLILSLLKSLCRGLYCEINNVLIFIWRFCLLKSWMRERILILIHRLEIKLLNQKKIVHCNSRLIKIWLVSLKKIRWDFFSWVMKSSYMKAYGRRESMAES